MSSPDDSALLRLLTRELRKLEQQLLITRNLQRKLAREDRELPDMTDPFADDLEGLARGGVDRPEVWIERRIAFLHTLEKSVARANPRERAYFWLGACATFLRPQPGDLTALREHEARLRRALTYYEALDEATEEEGESRLREEPWDGSAGLAPRRRMRASWILREALDLLAEQEIAFSQMEEEGEAPT